MKFTHEMLKAVPAGKVFAMGVAFDREDQLNLARTGKLLLWVCGKGHGYNDWAMYAHYLENGVDFVLAQGDKVFPAYGRAVFDAEDDVWEEFRN